MDQKTDTLTINNVVYKISDLNAQQQYLLSVFRTWQADATKLRQEIQQKQMEILKVEAALRDLGREIGTNIQNSDVAKLGVPVPLSTEAPSETPVA